MTSFLISANAVLPVILMALCGYFLKRVGLIPPKLAKELNQLIYKIFLPLMLFRNMYQMESLDGIRIDAILYAAVAILVGAALCVPLVMGITKVRERRGSLLQTCFRSNFALIGMALAQSLCGDEAGQAATLVSGIVIPLFNVLAVLSFAIFPKGEGKISVKKILLDIVKNPLIVAIVSGLCFFFLGQILKPMGIDFSLAQIQPLHKVINSFANVATPLALIALGAQFEFSVVGGLKKEILTGTLVRTVIFPLFGIGIAILFFRDRFPPAYFASFVAAFASPAAVSCVPLAQEMDGDPILSGQLVIWTTLISSVTVFLFSFAMSAMGIFTKI